MRNDVIRCEIQSTQEVENKPLWNSLHKCYLMSAFGHVKRVKYIYQLIEFFIAPQASKRHENMKTKLFLRCGGD